GSHLTTTDRQTDRGQPRPHFPSTPCEPARPISPHRDPGCRYSLLSFWERSRRDEGHSGRPTPRHDASRLS
ncbi:hypothetical protein M433DRAFT_486528, partial [Acidomyces richmondensis BFW]